MEKTLVIVKPDGVNRSLVGDILKRFEDKGLKVIGLKMERLDEIVLEEHYAHHKDKAFYKELIDFMASIPAVIIALEGNEAVRVVRQMVGATYGVEALPGTIRGDFSLSNQNNLVHASETIEIAEEEVKRFFKKNQLHDYNKMNFDWIYTTKEKE